MLKPLKDRVVIQMVEQEEKTAGGLFLPTTAQEKITICKKLSQQANSLLQKTVKWRLAIKSFSRNIQEQKLN